MVAESIETVVKQYLAKLKEAGYDDCIAVVYGSQVTGKTNQWSDIDLLVVSPAFDRKITRSDVSMLWKIAAATDSRIEPVAIGKIQYDTDDGNAIIEIARRAGYTILPAA